MGAIAIIGRLAAAAVCVALLACLIHAITIKRRERRCGAQSAIRTSACERLRYAAALSRMIQVPTLSGRDSDPRAFERLHDVMREEFPLVFERLERVEISGNLLFKWRGDGRIKDAIMLMGHQDVVPASGAGWAYPPFSGAIANGRVYGRGALDCKCTVAAEFLAVEELLAEGFVPACDVYLSCSVDEEVSGGGAALLVEHLRQEGVALSLVLDEGGAIVEQALPGLRRPCAMVGVSEKGYMDVKISAKSRGGHSSAPSRNSPIVRLARFICRMERKRPFDRRFSLPVTAMFKRMAPDLSFGMRFLLGNLWLFRPLIAALMPRISPYGEALLSTSFAFTMCSGSSAPNVIPSEAHVICNLRLSPHEGADAALGRIRKLAQRYGLEAEALETRDASRCADMAGRGYQAVERCLNECFPDIAVAPYLIMGGTDCREYEALSDGCIRICPVRMDRDQLESTHGVNENIHVAALGDAVKFYRRLIETYG